MAIIIDGKAVAADIKAECAKRSAELKQRGVTPGLAVILVGENPASQVYVRNKKKDCEECGFVSFGYELPENTPQTELLELLAALNSQREVDGILVQAPLPRQIDSAAVFNAIDPKKDVDCFCYENVGRLMAGAPSMQPCTPAGVMELLKRYDISPRGKNCVVLGRSNIVGKPMSVLLTAADGTVTTCHSKTENIGQICRGADILVSAIGVAGFVTADMVKEGATVIDVGMNRNAEGKLCGDVDFAAVQPKCYAITPVPGGVGPMTRAMLMKNTLGAALRRAGLN